MQGRGLNLTPAKRLGSRALALYLITFSVLFLEVALTKVLSVMLWHHFTYMVISVALLGFGAAGSYLTTTGRVSKETDPAAFSSRWSALYAISIPLCYAFMVRVNLDSLAIQRDPTHLWGLFLLYIFLFIPFLLCLY